MNEMGTRIKQKRLENNLTMEELGNKLGVQKAAINKWENGSVENIKRSTIKAMAEIFECSPAWLMGFDDKPVPNVDYIITTSDNREFVIEMERASRGMDATRLRAYAEAFSKIMETEDLNGKV